MGTSISPTHCHLVGYLESGDSGTLVGGATSGAVPGGTPGDTPGAGGGTKLGDVLVGTDHDAMYASTLSLKMK
jgi:hypothetical protein